MIGTREPPTFSNSQRYGSGFHGSPVVTNVRSDERSVAGSPCGSSARTSVGERPSEVTRSLLDGAARGGPASASRARPRRRRSSPPSAPTPTTVHGPMIQPMSVAKCTTSPCVHVGLVGGLARDRDEEAALDVHDALGLAGRAGGVGEEVRRLGVDLERGQLAGPAVELERRERRRARAGEPAARRLLEDREHRHAACRGATTRAA